MVFQGFKKVQKCRSKNDPEPTDTTRKPTLRVFFSNPRKIDVSKYPYTAARDHPPIYRPQKVIIFRTTNERTEVTDFSVWFGV